MSTLLAQMASLAPVLQTVVAAMDGTYTCPVETHFGFQMLSTRICSRLNLHSQTEGTKCT